jgi:hypothetical protein
VEEAAMSILHTEEPTQTVEPEVVEEPPAPPSVTAPELSRAWGWVLGGAWLAIFGLTVLTAPAPADPDAAPPLLGVLLDSALQLTWLVMIVGLIRRRAFGAVASIAGAGLLLVGAVACPVSGHHDWTAGWSLFQLTGAVVLLGLSTRALLSAKS